MADLIIFVVLIALGYFFGHYAEKKHYASINKREQEFLYLPAISNKHPIGKGEVYKCNLASGSVVISVDYFKRMLASLRNLFGGNVRSYETLLDRARREAVLRLKESCPKADEIINLRIETSSIYKGQGKSIGSVEILAYGTAIYFNATDKS